ncbi:enoyl-CoA hydratase-related protein [Nocardia salmonicida]|uniref:enoyl-CoA hydratase-related protein n=1 Tax=Nocardia salmonicida TaxID=53431 RepID=UPI0033CBB3D8
MEADALGDPIDTVEDGLMSDVVSTSIGNVRVIELDAPQRLNALDRGMLAEFAAAVEVVRADPDARALVVRASGRAFCAGADLENLFGDPDRPTGVIRDDLKGVYAAFLGLRALAVPTIAAVRGHAVGAGFNIAMACDVVVARSDARFAVSFADLGLHPGGGCSWFLTSRLGRGRALMTVLNADTITAGDAAGLGLVTELNEAPEERALALAAKWSERDPKLVRDMKRAIQLSETADLDDVIEYESWAQASSVASPLFRETLDRFAARAAHRQQSSRSDS